MEKWFAWWHNCDKYHIRPIYDLEFKFFENRDLGRKHGMVAVCGKYAGAWNGIGGEPTGRLQYDRFPVCDTCLKISRLSFEEAMVGQVMQS